MASSLIPVQAATPVGRDLPDLSADSNTVVVQDVPNIQDNIDDMVGNKLVYSDITTPLHHFTPSGQDSSTVKKVRIWYCRHIIL